MIINGERVLRKIFSHLQTVAGHDFSDYKRGTIIRRIRRRMMLKNIEKMEDYLDLIQSRREEAKALADDFLITVTEFFRDTSSFEQLEKEIIPRLFEEKGSADRVRVWTIGCSTGEEAYTLAILMLEAAHKLPNPPQLQIFASDAHEVALKHARDGIYPDSIRADIT
jgi:two-component system, chemotaxis family, CheB/CheR fusion protein